MKTRHKKSLVIMSSLSLIAAYAVQPAQANTFVFHDASKISDWAFDAVEFLAEEELLKGNTAGFFDPQRAMTRAEVAVLFTRAFSVSINEDVSTEFKDTQGHWAAKEIASLQTAYPELLTGYPDGTFRPDKPITRAEFAKLFVIMFELEENKHLIIQQEAIIPFQDHNNWAKRYIETLYTYGIAAGINKERTLFAPDKDVTREMVATFFYRYYFEQARLDDVQFIAELTPEGLPPEVTSEPKPKHFNPFANSDTKIVVSHNPFTENIQESLSFLLKDSANNVVQFSTTGLFTQKNNEPYLEGQYVVDVIYRDQLLAAYPVNVRQSKPSHITLKPEIHYVGEPSLIQLKLFNQYKHEINYTPEEIKWKIINKSTGNVVDTVVYDESLQNFVLTSDAGNSEDTLIVQAIHKPTLITTKKEIKLNAKREYDYLMITTIQEDGYFYGYLKDQYGKEIDIPSFNQFKITSSNEDVVESAMISMHKTDRVGYIRFEIAEVKSAGSTRIRIYDEILGKSYTNVIEVK